MIFITSDLHGNYKQFKLLYNNVIHRDIDMLIINGDVIDRGEQSAELCDFIINKSNIHLVLGNHEYIYMYAYKIIESSLTSSNTLESFHFHDKVFTHWISNGGLDTITSFNEFNLLNPSRNIYKEFYDYIKHKKFYYIFDNNIVVHSNPHINISLETSILDIINTLSLTDKSQLCEDRSFIQKVFKDKSDIKYFKHNVFVGHTPLTFLYNNLNHVISNRLFQQYNHDKSYYILNTDFGSYINNAVCFHCITKNETYMCKNNVIQTI